MYKICVYIPQSHVDVVKNAMFLAGAGKIGHYSHCSWQTLGEGQFLPLEGNHAFIGQTAKLEKVAEYLVEMICVESSVQKVLTEMKAAHPYETPAYHVIKIEEI
jgi:structural toxin protein (hemagglutinin/hemolysin) RtxA